MNKRLLLITTLFLLSVMNNYAAKEKMNLRLTAANIIPFQTIEVKDNKYDYMAANSNWNNVFTNYKATNNVILAFDEDYINTQVSDCDVTVEFLVKYYTYNSGTHLFEANTVSPNPVLTVNYNQLSANKNRSVYSFDGGMKVEIMIVSITSSIGNVPDNLIIEGEIETERYYNLNYTSQVSNLIDTYDSHTDEVVIKWNFLEGAEEYDLEWTYINNYSSTGSAASNIGIPQTTDKLFKYNSTRVTTFATEYRIPLLYEQGFILYRVRAVGRTGTDFKQRVFSRWSSFPDTYTNVAGFQHYYQITGHEKDLNWQMSVNYAEEGKNKASISYFDGSLRNRQSVTKSSTDNRVIVGEIIYDYQGRKAIQVLPTPKNDSLIRYYEDNNLNLINLPYNRKNFDFDTDTNSCVTITEPMSTANGSSKYYSGNNDVGGFNRNYIPDAKEYPFTQTEYTPDNTGRIRRESGVGIDHQLGTGHETKYYYGKPEQYELDRLFGSEAGYAKHYKKNMKIDPNGQISLEFIDLQGKTVATTLIGKVPENLEQLPNNFIENLFVDLLNKVHPTDSTGSENHYLPEIASNVYSREMLVATEGERNFVYEMRGAKFTDSCQIPICYDCIFDLIISLSNECNDEELYSNNTFTDILDTTIGTPTISCTSTPPSFDSRNMQDPWTSTYLNIGSHSLSKRLSINMDALNLYTNHYLNPDTNECILSYDDFLQTAMNNLDTSGCGMTCDECLASLGAYDTSMYNHDVNPNCDPCYSAAEFQQAQNRCMDLCDEGSIECDSRYELMLIDVSPMGQYGGVIVTPVDNAFPSSNVYSIPNQPSLTSGASIDPTYFPLSVFNVNNKLPLKNEFMTYHILPNWKYPYNPDYDDTDIRKFRYLNDDETISYIVVNYMGGQFFPAIDNSHTNDTIIDSLGVIRILPQYLSNIEDFIYSWQTNWANALVHYHPESGQYYFCVANSESHDFDWKWSHTIPFNNTSSNDDAMDYFFSNSQYYTNHYGTGNHHQPNPLGSDSTTALDPFFNSQINPFFVNSDYEGMVRDMSHYYTDGNGTEYNIWQMAHIAADCPNSDCAVANSTCIEDSTIQTDLEWRFFKSYYLSLKQRYYFNRLTKYSIDSTCYNGCIGNSNFNQYQNGFAATAYTPDNTGGYAALHSYWNPLVSPTPIPPSCPMCDNQYFNYEQTCNVYRYYYYEDKIKRFPRPDDALNLPQPGQGIQDYSNTQQNIADASVFENCGQCPVARDLQFFLNGMADTLLYNVDLSCTGGGIQEYVPDLQDVMFNSSGPVQWTVNSFDINNLSVTIHNDIDANCSLQLYADTNVSIWNSIIGFCCLEGITSPTFLNPEPGLYYFEVTALLSDSTQIVLEGGSCLNISDCNIDYLCHTTSSGMDVQNLFNNLLFSQDAVNNLPSANSVFTDNSVSFSLPPLNPAITNNLILTSGLSSNVNLWQWNANYTPPPSPDYLSMNNAILTDGTISCNIDLSFVNYSGTYDMDDIISFVNIRPDTDYLSGISPNFTTNHFLITALVNDNGVLKYVQLSGAVCFNIGECYDAEYYGSN